MKNGFWNTLPRRPFSILAPMVNVTDMVFRHVVAKCGKPDVFFTEFIASDGLMHPTGRKRLLLDLQYQEQERPIVAQIWGGNPTNIEGAARLVQDLGFDGVDINMGCPDEGVERQRGGASLIRDCDRAKQVIAAALKGADSLPVSVKTRIGYNSIITSEWVSALAGTGISALTVHLRTRKEMSKVPARWEEARIASDILCEAGVLSVGNGDISSLQDGREKAEKYGVDGIMLGRSIFGNPWLFSETCKPNWAKVFEIMIFHSQLFEEVHKGLKPFVIMRKFFKAYVAGHPDAFALRNDLMLCNSTKEVEDVLGRSCTLL